MSRKSPAFRFALQRLVAGYLAASPRSPRAHAWSLAALLPAIFLMFFAQTSHVRAVEVDEDHTIDVLFVYTAAEKAKVGGEDGIKARCNAEIEYNNKTYENSLINGKHRLVGSREVGYVESGDFSTDLTHLTSANDGVMDEVHAWRNEFGADLVCLMRATNANGVAGLAWLMQDPQSGEQQNGFSVIGPDVTWAYPHEVGHNLGCAHNREQGGNGIFYYSYGYHMSNGGGTIMSYLGNRVPHFSNPEVEQNGAPTGVSEKNADGSENHATSANCAKTINLTLPVVAKYRRFKPGVETPVITPAGGKFVDQEQIITITCATEGAIIRYTTDGSPVTASSTLYRGEFVLENSATVKARGFRSEGIPSETAEAVFEITYSQTVGDVIFSPEGGEFRDGVTVTLTTPTPDAKIYYSFGEKSEPTKASNEYSGNPLTLNRSTYLKARAYAYRKNPSAITSAIYTVTESPVANIPDITIKGNLVPLDDGGNGKTYYGPPLATITSEYPNATIRYTLDPMGDVTEESPVYTAPFLVTRSTTVRARVYLPDYKPSAARLASVIVRPIQIEKPGISPYGGSYVNSVLASLYCDTPNVYLRYTTNGDDLPDRTILQSENAKYPLYNPATPIRLSEPTLLKVRAYHPDYYASEQVAVQFNIRLPEEVRDEYGLRIAAGASHSLFLSANGVLSAAGRNNFGQLGTGDTATQLNPVVVANNVATVDASRDHTLFITRDGTLYSTGRNDYGQLGLGDTSASSRPVAVAHDILLAFAGGYHSLYITTTGALWSVGRNDYGQLGNGGAEKANPKAAHIADNVLTASVGLFHSLYLLGNGELRGMGRNDQGQLGDGSIANARFPIKIAENVQAVAAGEAHTVFVSGGILYATGSNSRGQLGRPNDPNVPGGIKFTVNPLPVHTSVKAVASGDNHVLFLTTDGKLYGLGDNAYGQLGRDPVAIPFTTIPVLIASNVKGFAAGAGHSLYTLNDDSRHSLGRNDYGQLADGTQTGKDAPVDIPDGIPSSPPELTPEPGTFEDGLDIRITGGDVGATFRYIIQREGEPERDVTLADTAYTNAPFRISRASASSASADEIVTVKTRAWLGNRPPSLQVVGKYILKPLVERIAPAFTLQPVSQQAVAWSTVTFAANASGSPAPTYQWYFNDNPISGATNSTYVIERASSAHIGKYRVRATNPAGTADSTEVRLELLAAPRITRNPQGAQLYEGSTLELTVAVASETSVAYQWRRDGVEISGATNATLQIPKIRASQSGNYDVVVSNSAGFLVSEKAIVSVLATNGAPIILRQPALASPVYIGGNAVFSVNVSSPENDPPRYQWRRDGSDLPGQTFATCSLYGLTADLSGDYTVVVTNSRGSVTSNALRVEVLQSGAIVLSRPLPPLVETAEGLSVALAVEVDASRVDPAPTYQWFFKGNAITGANAATLLFPAVKESNLGTYTVEIVSGPNKTTSGPTTLAFVNPPEILTKLNPETVTAPAGVGTELSVAINDGGAKLIEYQWMLDGTAITGANAATYRAVASGFYTVRVTNGAGSVLGEIARVSIVGPPVINSFSVTPSVTFTGESEIFNFFEKVNKSEGLRVASGDLLRFEVALQSGGDPLEYTWYLDGAPLHGAPNAPVLETREVTRDCTYSVRVTNAAGSAHSQSIRLRVIQPPTIIRHPVGLELRAGSNGELTVTAEGSGQLAYQWFKDGVAIRNAVLPRYVIREARDAHAGIYHVEVSNFTGAPTKSKEVTVTVRNSNVAEPAATPATASNAAVLVGQGSTLTVHPEPALTLDPATFVSGNVIVEGCAQTGRVGGLTSFTGSDGKVCLLENVVGGNLTLAQAANAPKGTFVFDSKTLTALDAANGAPQELPVGTRILLAGDIADSAKPQLLEDDSVLEILPGNRLPNGTYTWKRISDNVAELSYVITHGQGTQQRVESGVLRFTFTASSFGTYILFADYVSTETTGELNGLGDFQLQK